MRAGVVGACHVNERRHGKLEQRGGLPFDIALDCPVAETRPIPESTRHVVAFQWAHGRAVREMELPWSAIIYSNC